MPEFSGHSPNHSVFRDVHLEEAKTNKGPTVHQGPEKPQGDICDLYGFK